MRPRSRALAAAAATTATVLACVAAGPAPAARSEHQAAPAYPNTRLAIKVKGRPRAGAITTVIVSGSNERLPISEGSDSLHSYHVELFVQNPRVLRQCPVSYDAELNNVINLSAHVKQIGRYMYAGDGGSFRLPVKYQSGSIRRVLFCAYTRVIVDDAAVSALRYTFAPARR